MWRTRSYLLEHGVGLPLGLEGRQDLPSAGNEAGAALGHVDGPAKLQEQPSLTGKQGIVQVGGEKPVRGGPIGSDGGGKRYASVTAEPDGDQA